MLLENYNLDTDTFEGCIAKGRTISELLILFRRDQKQMDKWCLENYGCDFTAAYTFLRTMAIDRFSGIMDRLAEERGNTSAIGIMDRLLNGVTNQTVKIVFDNKMEQENERDKIN